MFLLPASSRARIVLCVLAFLAFLLVPGAPDSEFSGMPVLGTALVCFLASVVILVFVAMFVPLRRVGVGWAFALITLAVAKAFLAPWTFAEGWRAAYEVIDLRGTAPISFIDGPSARPFRIDRRIDFNGPFFNLPFFNDIFRYSEHYSPQRRDVEFSFRVQWTGYTVLDEQEPLSFTVGCVGGLSFNVDTKSEFDGMCPKEGSFNISTRILPKGPHLIQAGYTKPPFSTPRAVIQPDGPWRMMPVRVSPRAASRSAVVTEVTTVLGWSACALLLLSLWRAYTPILQTLRTIATVGLGRAAVVAAFTILLAMAVNASLGYRNVTVNILTGDDPLAYEGFARDIFFNGLLLPSWKAPFYFYPFYPYVLAVAHIVFGEDLSSAVVLHGLCLASLTLLFWRLGWKHLPMWGLVVGLVALGYYCRKYYFPFMLNAYTDHLFAFLAFVAIGASVWALGSKSSFAWFVAGLATAFAAATRPSMMTYPAVLGLFVILGSNDRPTRWRIGAALTLVGGFLVGLLPFTIRNWLVSGKVVLLVNSWIQIPYFLYAPEEPNRATLVAGLGEALQQAWRMAAERPMHVLMIELRKLGFTFGWLRLGPPGEPATLDFVALSVLFVTALILRRIPRTVALVVSAFAVSHVASMILAAPWSYVLKPILPLHLAFLFGAGFLLTGKLRAGHANAFVDSSNVSELKREEVLQN
jgi:hypothetical protein